MISARIRRVSRNRGVRCSGVPSRPPPAPPMAGRAEALRGSPRSAGDIALERVGQRLAEAGDQGDIRAGTEDHPEREPARPAPLIPKLPLGTPVRPPDVFHRRITAGPRPGGGDDLRRIAVLRGFRSVYSTMVAMVGSWRAGRGYEEGGCRAARVGHPCLREPHPLEVCRSGAVGEMPGQRVNHRPHCGCPTRHPARPLPRQGAGGRT
jgi:hypothetical protein